MEIFQNANLTPAQESIVDCGEFSREQRRCHLIWSIKPVNQQGFRARLNRREFGGVVFAEVDHDPIWAARSMSDINRREDCVIGLSLFTKGSMTFRQEGRELQLETDDLLLWDGMRPAGIRSWEAVECKTILFPRNLISQHIGNIDDITGQKNDPGSGMSHLLKSHIETLHQSFGLIEPRDRINVLRATMHLIEAGFRSSEARKSGSTYHRALFRRIEEFMRETLLDHDCSPAAVAAAFGVSYRYLHRLFSEAGTTFSDWVREERLVRAEKALTSKSFAGQSITLIAHRFGFCDAAHFSNLFKARFGKPPSLYRAAAAGKTMSETDISVNRELAALH